MSLISRSRSWGLVVQALAPSPKGMSLASSMASSILFTRNTKATGPKNSSLAVGESRGISVKIVGG